MEEENNGNERNEKKRKAENDLNSNPPKLMRFDDSQEGFNAAVRVNNHREVERLLLHNPNINPADDHSFAMRYAAEHGFVEIIKLLLVDKRADPALDGKDDIDFICPITLAVTNGHYDIVKLLLGEPRIDPTFENAPKEHDIQPLLELSLDYRHEDISLLLLSDERIEISETDLFLHQAIRNGYFKLVKCLLSHDDSAELIPDQNDFLDKDKNDLIDSDDELWDFTLKIAVESETGEFKITRLLLEDGRFNPAVNDNYVIKCACKMGKYEAVKILLGDPRISLKNDKYSDDSLSTIEAACLSDNPDIVKLVLSHKTIDFEQAINFALPYAAKNCTMEVLECLLSFNDKSANKKDLQKKCFDILSCRKFQNGYFARYYISCQPIESKEIPSRDIEGLALKNIVLFCHLGSVSDCSIWAYVKHNHNSKCDEKDNLTQFFLERAGPAANKNNVDVLIELRQMFELEDKRKEWKDEFKKLFLSNSNYMKDQEKKAASIYKSLFSTRYPNCTFFWQASSDKSRAFNETQNPLPQLLMGNMDIVKLILQMWIKLIQRDIDDVASKKMSKQNDMVLVIWC